MSYKVEVQGRGEKSWHTNALRFRTKKEADAYGSDLYSRWMGAEAVRTRRSGDPVNYVADKYGRAHPISANILVPKSAEIEGYMRRRIHHPHTQGDRLSIAEERRRRARQAKRQLRVKSTGRFK